MEAVEERILFAALSINDVVVTEGNSGTTDAVFTVTLSQPGDQQATVNYTTADSTATTPADYQPTSGTLVFTPGGATTQNIVVKVVGDTTQENNEQFSVNLNTPVNATLVGGASSGTGYIVDDDDDVLTIQNVIVPEGDTGTTNAVFTVTRSGSTAGTTSVNYATAPSSALSPADFATTSGTLVFAPGETAKTFTVAVVGDTLQENSEQFGVNLSGAVNGTIFNGNAVGTIIDDDDSSFTVSGGTFGEGDRDPAPLVFTVTRHGSLDGPASVQYQTQNSSATAGDDYAAASGTLNFAPGEATKQVPVAILPDTIQETTEVFTLNLSNAVNATIADASAQGMIVDNDAASWSVESAAVTEGNTGTTAMQFTVRRAGQASGPATISYATSNSSAAAPADFVAANGTLSFAPLETEKTITIQVNGDTQQEPDEAFFVSISNPSTGTLTQSTAQGLIVDDDESFLAVRSDDVAVTEGDSGTKQTTFTVTRYGSLAGATSVTYTTLNGSAQAPSDYAVTSGTLNFAPGESTKTISVDVNGDATVEGNEYFYMTLGMPTNGTVAANNAPVWIANDDGAVDVAYYFLGDASVAEGDSGTTPATFTVKRLGATGAASSVNYSIAAPTGNDYQVASGTLSFAPGETSKTFAINVVGDTTVEGTEPYTAVLSAPTAGSAVADNAGTLTIVDDDDVALWVSDASTVEGDAAAGHDVHLTVRRFGKTAGQSTVNYTTQNSTATSPQDYNIASGTVVFGPGEDTKDITLHVLGDTLKETDESFFVNLSTPDNGTVEGGNAEVIIFDDDRASLTVGDVTVVEGTGAAAPTADFVVTRYGSTDGQVSVDYKTTNSSATAPDDFASISGTLTFAPGETTKTVSVAVNGDSLQEFNEQFFLDLSAPVNVDIARNRGTGLILDDDASEVTLTGNTVVEGDTGTKNEVFTLNRFGSLAGTSSVEFRTLNSNAQAPGDYSQVVQTVTFNPGESVKTVPVQVVGDTLQEGNELFSSNLQAANNTTIVNAGNSFGQIIDDDESFLFIDNVVVTEGDPGSPHNAVFTVRRFGSLDGQATVNYATQNSSAQSPGDFTLGSGTVTFAPGVASQTITIPITPDRIHENEEQFFVNLSGADNATIGDFSGHATILDDDPAPAVEQVFFGGSTWGGDDGNAANTTFKEYLQAQGLGSVQYGYAIPAGSQQLTTLPWINVNRVSIKFTAPVIVDQGDLQVRGGNTPTYAFLPGAAGFSYDPDTFVATWTFDQNLTKDRLLLDLDSSANGVHNDGGELLDGEWANGGDSYPSGNGFGGGDFLFRVNVLPGDVDRASERVNAIDLGYAKARNNRSIAEGNPPPGFQPYTPFADGNADGRINAVDLGIVKARLNNSLPTQPQSAGAAAGGASITRDLFGTRPILA